MVVSNQLALFTRSNFGVCPKADERAFHNVLVASTTLNTCCMHAKSARLCIDIDAIHHRTFIAGNHQANLEIART